MKDLNGTIAKKVLEYIPQNHKPIQYLMDFLNLSSESIYRRVRGEIPFTLEEIVKLSHELNFSIDEILGESKVARVFFDLQKITSVHPEEAFLEMFQYNYELFQDILKAKETEIIHAYSRLNILLLLGNDSIFKFFYYKWLHQTGYIPSNTPFSELEVPPKIVSIAEKLWDLFRRINNRTYIMDKYMYLSIIKDIQYYYTRKLISDEEMEILKADFLDMIDYTEQLAQKGRNKYNSIVRIYISTLDVESDSSVIVYDDKMESHYWVYAINPMIIKNKETCLIHKQWLETIKRYTMLITKSNEMFQSLFFEQQRTFLNNMRDIMY